jgi:hypothetical protein
MDKRGKRWQDLNPGQRQAIVVVGAVTSVLQIIMLWDLRRRPAEEVRGSKKAWVAASFVRPLGQIAYLIWGRTKGGVEN